MAQEKCVSPQALLFFPESEGVQSELGQLTFIYLFFLFLKKIIYFNWRLITLQYCGGFCHTST